MISGIGIDITDLERIEAAWSQFGEKFLQKISRGGELRVDASHPLFLQELAALFSVKEAVFKAFKPSFPIRFRDIRLEHLPSGAPKITLEGRLEQLGREKGISRVEVSISHERSHAVAVAVTVGMGVE